MRIITILLAGGALLLSHLGVAQGIYYLDAPTSRGALAPGPAYIARVVDARAQRASVGSVSRGEMLLMPATFRAGVRATLQPFYDTYAPGQPGAVPLVLRLTGLEIAETLGHDETAVAGCTADLYAPQPDSTYRLVSHYANVHAQSNRRPFTDATKLHAANLGVLLLGVADAARSQAAWLPAGPAYPAAYVLAPTPHPEEQLPILRPATQPRPGIYHSVVEFWHNQPSEPGLPDVEKHPYLNTEWAGDSEVKLYRPLPTNKLEMVTDAWGFCDGQDYYVRRERSYYRLRRQGPGFVYYGQVGEDPQYRMAVNGRSFNNSLLMGSVLASASAPSLGRRALFTLHLLPGTVSLDQAPTLAETPGAASRPTHLFVYRPRGDKGPAVRIRLADDQPAQELAPGDYLTFEPASEQPLRVCLLPAAGPAVYLPITPTAEAPTYLECRAAASEPLRQVKDATGAAALNRLVK
ncbi:hypothetical protein E4631_06580 [Hymenobacter sp. UV11]|uniref:hypothetical protein n=1 Tax=Hymenobacter sp. UV11 TaxID=1849735 RepID=UPI0010610E63|nr:hypothetical protein [Hymenobacter sp. UV11]TFZ67639.1 hypothetical protein E4631_06580 [Hymenobacter sp. UV11]